MTSAMTKLRHAGQQSSVRSFVSGLSKLKTITGMALGWMGATMALACASKNKRLVYRGLVGGGEAYEVFLGYSRADRAGPESSLASQ